MPIAYRLIGQQNDSHMFPEFFNENNNIFCECCNKKRDPFAYRAAIEIKIKNFDFSTTYDDVYIVSKRFKNFFQNNFICESQFILFEKY